MSAQASFKRAVRMAKTGLLAVVLTSAVCGDVQADSVRFVPDGRDAWRTRVEIIRAARRSIDVAVFIWRDDRTGLEMAGLLQEAARRGVRVRIIADGLARSMPTRVTAALAGTPGLEIHDYHPLLVHRPDWLNCRLHDKLLIVDGGKLLIGGRNFTDCYYDRRNSRDYLDLDLLVCGDASASAQRYFEALWRSGEIRDVPLSPLLKPVNGGRFRARTELDVRLEQSAGQRLVDQAMGSLDPEVADRARDVLAVPSSRIEFVSEAVPRTSDQSKCVSRIEALLGQAKSEVWISTPWLVTTERTEALLRGCLERGVKLHVLTNSLHASRDYIVFGAHERTCRDLDALGAAIHVLPGPGSLHTKAIVIDRSVAVAGTLNFDPRSEFWNTESMVVVRHPPAARELLEVIRGQSRDSRQLGADGGSLMGARSASVQLRMKKAFLPVLKLFSPLIRSFL